MDELRDAAEQTLYPKLRRYGIFSPSRFAGRVQEAAAMMRSSTRSSAASLAFWSAARSAVPGGVGGWRDQLEPGTENDCRAGAPLASGTAITIRLLC